VVCSETSHRRLASSSLAAAPDLDGVPHAVAAAAQVDYARALGGEEPIEEQASQQEVFEVVDSSLLLQFVLGGPVWCEHSASVVEQAVQSVGALMELL
jgi:hypothetical protein